MVKRGRPTLTEQRAEELRLAIARTAVEIFVADGDASASVERIADAAGVSTRTFYRRFATKEDVVRPLFRQSTDEVIAALRNAPSDGDVVEALVAAWTSALHEGTLSWFERRFLKLMASTPQYRQRWLGSTNCARPRRRSCGDESHRTTTRCAEACSPISSSTRPDTSSITGPPRTPTRTSPTYYETRSGWCSRASRTSAHRPADPVHRTRGARHRRPASLLASLDRLCVARQTLDETPTLFHRRPRWVSTCPRSSRPPAPAPVPVRLPQPPRRTLTGTSSRRMAASPPPTCEAHRTRTRAPPD